MSVLEKLIDKRIAACQTELIQTHYAEVENMYRQMRGWRHDYRSHIQAMKSYAASGDLAAVQSYLDQLDTDLSAVDTIVNSKISLAGSKNIAVRADAHVPVALTTAELDLCIIIGNLFDNAIEASLSLPEEQRMIRVYMDMKNTQLYMSFTNRTAQGKQKKENGLFKTTKGHGRGFGLVRIDTIIERYSGYISRNSEDGAFTTEILLPQ